MSSVADIVHIRRMRIGEEQRLHAVFYSAVHELTTAQYTAEQRAAWAPREYDEAAWCERIQRNQPFIAELDGQIAGYADVQPSGYIDQFFVAPEFSGRSVGRALMERIHAEAAARGLPELWSNVSLTAEPFFARHGFVVEDRQTVTVRGVEMSNARMRKRLA